MGSNEASKDDYGDFIPLISKTKAKSRLIATINLQHLIPGHHRAVGKEYSYIDDLKQVKLLSILKIVRVLENVSIPRPRRPIP